jgi:hypothetical protein
MKNAFPAKSYDFIGAGLPQIVGPAGELYDFIANMGGGKSFKKIIPEDIAHAIIDLKKDPQLLAEMRNKVISNRNNFGRRIMTKSYFNSL